MNARAIREQSLGQHHPETAQTLHDLAIFHQKQGRLREALPFAERALSIRAQSLGDTHPKTVATRTLYAQLVQEQEYAEQGGPAKHEGKENQNRFGKERISERASASPQETANASPSENDSLQGFLDACCELHPRAWCRISDLWQAYEHWGMKYQARFPLSRRAFAAQLKARGCRVDRTSTARIWRGITLVNNEP